MNKKLMFGLFLTAVSVSFTGCEGLLDDCKVCSINTYEDDLLIHSTDETEYCGAQLAIILSTPEEVDGNLVSRWECR
ncbi:MAG: hypothetical protein LC649_07590 [Bacteroidales bacterium]|nr:hypothetical protein [Bacteroidales bacterium]